MALIVCTDPQEQLRRATADIASVLRAAIAAQGHARLAVSGGRSPIPLFSALAAERLDWSAVTICLVDERVVAPDHADSNAALVRAHLLTGPAAAATFEPLVDDPADRDGCVQRANARAMPLTLAILGMGDDGHMASLFPGAAQTALGLDPAFAHVYLAVDPPAAAHPRISMSLSALLQAERIVLWISGDTKRAVFERAAQRPDPALPVSYVLNQTRVPVDVYWAR